MSLVGFGDERGATIPELGRMRGKLRADQLVDDYAPAEHEHAYASDTHATHTGDDTAWHEIGAAGEPAFQNGWVNWGGGDATAAFKRLGGVVYIKGTIKSGVAGTFFTLPVGYRPAKSHYFSAASNGGYAEASISSAGDVIFGVGSSVWFSLTTSFVAEQ